MRILGLVRRSFPGLVAFLLVPLCLAQQAKPPDNPGDATNTRGNTPRPPGVTQPGEGTRPQRPNFQTLFISGIVVQEDGSPLPAGAVIERVCGGRVKKEAYVSTSGAFSFQIGGGNAYTNVFPDASDESLSGFGTFGRATQSGSLTAAPDPVVSTSLIGCELRAQLAGYRSSSIILDGYNPTGSLDIGTILVQPISKSPGTTVSVLDMRAPKEAKKSMERAERAIQKKDLAQAEKELRAALAAFPDYASAWFRLGLVYQQQDQTKNAREAFSKAIAADDKFVKPYIQLARLAGMEQKWQEVADLTDRALALDPLDYPEGYLFNSLAYFVINRLDVAERSARKAQRLDAMHRFPRINLVLADILEKKQDLAGCMEQLQAYLKMAPAASDADTVRSRIQRLEQVSKSLASSAPQNP